MVFTLLLYDITYDRNLYIYYKIKKIIYSVIRSVWFTGLTNCNLTEFQLNQTGLTDLEQRTNLTEPVSPNWFGLN